MIQKQVLIVITLAAGAIGAVLWAWNTDVATLAEQANRANETTIEACNALGQERRALLELEAEYEAIRMDLCTTVSACAERDGLIRKLRKMLEAERANVERWRRMVEARHDHGE